MVAACLVAGPIFHVRDASAAAVPAQCAPPAKYQEGVQAKKYLANCLLCALIGVKRLASTYHFHSASARTVATLFARKTAPAELRGAVESGCFRGFMLSKKEKSNDHGGSHESTTTTTTTTTTSVHGHRASGDAATTTEPLTDTQRPPPSEDGHVPPGQLKHRKCPGSGAAGCS